MKSRLKEKWLFTLLSFFIVVTASLPFLSVYALPKSNTFFFIGMLALICFMTVLIQRYLIVLPLYVISYLFTLYYYFPFERPFGFTWIGVFAQRLLQTYAKMFSGEINYLPDFFALSIILFLLILLCVLFIRYERWALGSLLLIGYLLMLAVFNQLNLSIPVILISSFALLFYSLKQMPTTLTPKKKSAFVLLSSFILFLIAGISSLFPLMIPQPKNFLLTQSASVRHYMNKQGLYRQIEEYGSSIASKTGFSENDAQLGGPINDDQTILFTAKQTSDHYWRVETKNHYTGKGWTNTSEIVTHSEEQTLSISTNPEYQGALAPETTITLTFRSPKEYLPYPYGNTAISFDEIGRTEQIKEKQRFTLLDSPTSFNFTWQKPIFAQESLAQVPYTFSQDKQNIFVPVTTPKRVEELARSLTENEETLYEKVTAIERYLKQNGGYRYSKTDTPYTPQTKDYVDYFLFESKVGYCDNFSSAMTVLLRSIGIPARWAKGFSSGEVTGGKNTNDQEYTIKNSDAHSWPEVYFEGYGWIPFEPTPSFTNTVSQPETTTTSTSNSQSETTTETISSSEMKNTSETTTSSVATQKKEETSRSTLSQWLPILRNVALVLFTISLVVIGFFLKKYFFLLRFRLHLILYPKQFSKAYRLLLRKAEQLLVRQIDEPLNEYAKRFEANYIAFHGSFIQLTVLYEQALYGGIPPEEEGLTELLTHTARLLTDLKKRSPSS